MRTPVWKTRSTSTHFVICSKTIELNRRNLSASLFSCLFRLFSVQSQQRTSKWVEERDHRSWLPIDVAGNISITRIHPSFSLSTDTRSCFSPIFESPITFPSWHADIRPRISSSLFYSAELESTRRSTRERSAKISRETLITTFPS